MPYKDPEKKKQWFKAHYEANREQIQKQGRIDTQNFKVEVLGHYSIKDYPVCAHCGIDDIDVLCIDHINNDGATFRKEQGIGTKLYCWLKREGYPDGFQVLCANCNLKKELQRRRESAIQ